MYFHTTPDYLKKRSIEYLEKLVALGLNERPVPFKCSCELPTDVTSYELWLHCLHSDHMKNAGCSDCHSLQPGFTSYVHIMSECGSQINVLKSQMVLDCKLLKFNLA